MSIKVQRISDVDGTPVYRMQIQSSSGVLVSILNYGAIVQDWRVPSNKGELRPVVIGYKTVQEYMADTAYVGAIIGRVANRIEGSQFKIGEKNYRLDPTVGADHLHGGPTGISKKFWSVDTDEADNAVYLTCSSPDGEGGYPGRVDFSVRYRLDGFGLKISMSAAVSEITPINMVQHNYFNLGGEVDIAGHELKVSASQYTPLSESLIPTGRIDSVTGSRFDFREFKGFKNANGEIDAYDINFVLNPSRQKDEVVAELKNPVNDLYLRMKTDQPGLQLYNSEYLPHRKFGGICLEDQQFPAAINRPEFPTPLITPECGYHHHCEIEITS